MEKQLFNYDETDIQSILDYSQHLLDRSLGEIIAEYQVSPYKTYRDFREWT
ncbi:TPA: DNA mismatch repair protein MutH, partial [Streptococcus suis]|nr:DNA mismatch repair protein MutH [Streptococcus suis]HEM6318125.1 DNA mismatch repair protein MutH [Streptococcus suis]